jgi:hypothetical protein
MAEVTEEQQKHPGPGQPTCYRESYTEQAYKLTLLGATDADLADFFDVCERTINNWKQAFPEFLQSIKRGKMSADADVAASLHHRATGYSHPEDKIFLHEGKVVVANTTKHYPPDTGAAMAWLKNRRRKDWCESYDFTSAGEKIVPQIISFADAVAASVKEAKQEGGDVDPE